MNKQEKKGMECTPNKCLDDNCGIDWNGECNCLCHSLPQGEKKEECRCWEDGTLTLSGINHSCIHGNKVSSLPTYTINK